MSEPNAKILVWDAPVRVFHWLLVLSFAGAYLTAESETWRLLHVTLGYTMGALLAFRLLWGVLGTRYARFASFVRGPRAVRTYLWSMLAGKPAHYVGHNPAGAVAIVLMLLSGTAIVATGWANYNDWGGEWLGEVHEGAANFMLALVGVHIAGVVLASWQHHENLPQAMVTGYKQGDVGQAIHSPWRIVAVLMLLAVLVFWYLQWHGAPALAVG